MPVVILARRRVPHRVPVHLRLMVMLPLFFMAQKVRPSVCVSACACGACIWWVGGLLASRHHFARRRVPRSGPVHLRRRA